MMTNFKLKRGFTVLESLFAISVVSLAIAGATLAVRGGLYSSSLSKEQVKAFYMAQEAIEIIRNKRDSNVLANTNWLTGIANSGDPCATGRICYVDGYNNQLRWDNGCTGTWGSCPVLRQKTTSGVDQYIYGYDSSWSPTNFKREVMIEPMNSNNEVMVTVSVSWNHGILPREFKTKTTLTNWAI